MKNTRTQRALLNALYYSPRTLMRDEGDPSWIEYWCSGRCFQISADEVTEMYRNDLIRFAWARKDIGSAVAELTEKGLRVYLGQLKI